MSESPQNLSQALIEAARRAGADAADALAICGTAVSVKTRDGALEQAERAEGTDVGLRVFVGQRQACVSTSDVRPDSLTTMAERAVAMARVAPADPHIGLADPAQLATGTLPDLDIFDPSGEPDTNTLQERALEAEAAARAVSGVSAVDETGAMYGERTMHLAASNGLSLGYRRSSHSLYATVISGEGTGMEIDHDGDSRVHASDMRSPAEIGTLAAERAVARSGARKPPTGQYPVIFDERVSSSLIAHLLGAINGQSISMGASWMRDKLGQQVLPTALSLVEDPLRPRIIGSRPFDGEGLPTQRRAIVEDGILTGWTLDLATARKLGMQSTANAMRGVTSPPSPGAGNVTLTQGSASRADLLRDVGTGLLITSMIGSTINPNTGDYSRGAAGMWIENGELQYPVNECTVAGNLVDMLRGLVPANDARPHLARVVPSLLVEGLTIAGA